MMQQGTCPIWRIECTLDNSHGYSLIIDSPRAGGRYWIDLASAQRLSSDTSEINSRHRAVLSTWILSQHDQGFSLPYVTEELVGLVQNGELRPLTPYERADRLLVRLASMKTMGEQFNLAAAVAQEFVLVATESIDNTDCLLLLEHLSESGLVDVQRGLITLRGHQRASELETSSTDSKQAFIAMWFDESMNKVRSIIERAVRASEYIPFIVDVAHFDTRICDKIEAEIRRSRFMVADFTHGNDGARGSVYFEAGLAKGLNIPVIWTCRDDQMKEVHFDTNQYPHILWTMDDLAGFGDHLRDRITNLLS